MRIVRVIQGFVVLVGLVAGGWAATRPGSDVLLLPVIWCTSGVLVVWLDEFA